MGKRSTRNLVRDALGLAHRYLMQSAKCQRSCAQASLLDSEPQTQPAQRHLPISAILGDPYISPLRARNLTNLPPAPLIGYGADDPMRGEAEDCARRLMHDGVAAKVSLYPEAI